MREGPLTWTRAFNRIKISAEKEGRKAFAWPEGGRYEKLVSQGYLKLKSEALIEIEPIQEVDNNKSREALSNLVHEDSSQHIVSVETFDSLFDRWANEAVQVAGFKAEKPLQQDRIPTNVKKKIATLWQKKICYPDAKPARFRMLDTKRGGPYSWFSYYTSNQTIYPNWEYFVQVAAFNDLIVEFSYLPEWMKFEYHETVPPVWLAVDIGIKFPDGRKAFVEVKEKKDQWDNLISAVQSIGFQGVDLSSQDRGNDPLRKAKSLQQGGQTFLSGITLKALILTKWPIHRGCDFLLSQRSSLMRKHL